MVPFRKAIRRQRSDKANVDSVFNLLDQGADALAKRRLLTARDEERQVERRLGGGGVLHARRACRRLEDLERMLRVRLAPTGDLARDHLAEADAVVVRR